MCGRVFLIQHDEFVGDYAHLLECNSLSFSSWETLDNPAFLPSFHLFNLLLYKFNHDFISDIAVCCKGLLNVLTELLIFLCDLTSDQVTN